MNTELSLFEGRGEIPNVEEKESQKLRNLISNVDSREDIEAICEIMVALHPEIYMDVLKNRYLFTLRTMDKFTATVKEHNDVIAEIVGDM